MPSLDVYVDVLCSAHLWPVVFGQLRHRQVTPPSGSRVCASPLQRCSGPSTCYEACASYTLRRLQLALLPSCLRLSGIIPSPGRQVLVSLPRYDQGVWRNRARELRLCRALANFCSLGCLCNFHRCRHGANSWSFLLANEESSWP